MIFWEKRGEYEENLRGEVPSWMKHRHCGTRYQRTRYEGVLLIFCSDYCTGIMYFMDGRWIMSRLNGHYVSHWHSIITKLGIIKDKAIVVTLFSSYVVSSSTVISTCALLHELFVEYVFPNVLRIGRWTLEVTCAQRTDQFKEHIIS